MSELSNDFLKAIATAQGVSEVEWEALQLALDGRTAEEIAGQFHISAVAVRKRLGSIYLKFGITGNIPGKLETLRNALLQKGQKSLPPPSIHDWGEAVSTLAFYGRTEELATLEYWITQQHCRLVVILGMGGIGKTTLTAKLSRQMSQQFRYIVWRSLREKPQIKKVLEDLIKCLSQQHDIRIPDSIGEAITQLISYLRQSRCLLILDNVESIFQKGTSAGQYQAGYEDYGILFKRISESEHQSCLLLTSREKPKEIAAIETETLQIRSLQLKGLERDAKEILEAKGLVGSVDEKNNLIDLYDGNPLALKIVATAIKELFNGCISEFLLQGATEFQEPIIFSDIRDLIGEQFERLSELERIIMYWLAINREPISLLDLKDDLFPIVSVSRLLESLDYLGRRSLIEKRDEKDFTLQNAVMEYVTDQFIEQIVDEIQKDKFDLFNQCALIKSTGKDHVRETQTRLILKPIAEKLQTLIQEQTVDEWAIKVVTTLRGKSARLQGYAGGNLLNLLCYLKIDLTQYDFSHLTIRQAYLQEVSLANVNFSQATIVKSAFTETFGSVLSVRYSPDGRFLAVGDANGDIRLWRVSDYQQVLTCQGHTSWVWSVAFSPQGSLLASGSEDQTIRLWDTRSGQCLHILREHTSRIRSVDFSPDGRLLASSSEDRTIRLWDTQSAQCLRTLHGHTDWIRSIAFSPKNDILASSSNDGTVKLWEVHTGRCMKTLRDSPSWSWSVAFSSDGQLLASGREDGEVRVWNVATGKCLKKLQKHTSRVRAVAFSRDGRLVSGSDDQSLQLWDVATGHYLKSLHGHTNCIRSITINPDSQTLASGSEDETVRVWNLDKGLCFKSLHGHMNGIRTVAFSPNGQILASGGSDHTIRLWDVHSSSCLRTVKGHSNWVWSVAFSPDGQILASGSSDHTIRLWDVRTGQWLRTFQGHSNWVWSVVFSPNGQILASSSEDQTIRIWDIQSGLCLRVLQEHDDKVRRIAFSPNGTQLVSGSDDHTVRLWDVQSGRCLRTFKGHSNWVWSVAFSPDGHLLASGSEDKTVQIWEIQTGRCLKVLSEHQDWVRSVSFSPDGQMLASGSNDCTVKLWDMKSGKCLRTLDGHTNRVQTVTFSADGSLIATGSDDETIQLWRAATGDLVATFRIPRPYESMNITGVKHMTSAQKTALKALGAVEHALFTGALETKR